MRRVSTAFIVMMTVRLLSRSAKPGDEGGQDQRQGGTPPWQGWSAFAMRFRRLPGRGVAVADRMPSSATMNFQALSLKGAAELREEQPS